MQKTVTVNISGQSFFIDEEAHSRLSLYLKKIETWFGKKDSGQEIIVDIESRLAELFSQKINPSTGVITLSIVDDAIATMGQPEEFEEEVLEESTSPQEPSNNTYIPKAPRKLYRDVDNRAIGGVCAGLAAYLNIDTALARVLYVLITLGSAGSGVVVYVILWAVLEPAVTTAQKLEMRGESVNISNIEKTIRDEYEEVKKGFSKMKESESFQKGKSFLDKMNQRDRTIAVVVMVLIGVLLMTRLLSFTFWMPFHGFPPMIHFPILGMVGWIIPLTLVLAGIALITKKNVKPILLIAFFIIIAVLIAKFIMMIHFSHFSINI